MVDIRFEIGSALWPLGELERAALLLREAKAYVDTLGDPRRQAHLLCLMTVQCEMSGEQQSAIASARRAVAAEANDRGLEAVANLYLGQAYYIIGEFREAQRVLERSIDLLQGDLIFERLGMLALPSVLARAGLAWALAEVGDFEAAQAHADAAIAIAEALTQPWRLISGIWAQASPDYAEARL